MPTSSPQLMDVTLRDGSYAIDYAFTTEHTRQIVSGLAAAGMPYIELAHGSGLGAAEFLGKTAGATDVEYVCAAAEVCGQSRIGAIVSPYTPRTILDAVAPYLHFLRCASNADDAGPALAQIEYTSKKGLMPFMQLMRSSRVSDEVLLMQARRAADAGAQVVYLVDTIGAYQPQEVSRRISLMKSELSTLVGFHAHDNLSQANANTLAAIAAGADFVDASLRGMGRGAGNACMEKLVAELQHHHRAENISLKKLIIPAERVVDALWARPKEIPELDRLTAQANIDLYPMELYQRIAAALGFGMPELIQLLGAVPGVVEVGLPHIEQVIHNQGRDVQEVFAAAGIVVRK